MVVFDCGLRGMALNLEESNVGVVIFGDDRYTIHTDMYEINLPVWWRILHRKGVSAIVCR